MTLAHNSLGNPNMSEEMAGKLTFSASLYSAISRVFATQLANKSMFSYSECYEYTGPTECITYLQGIYPPDVTVQHPVGTIPYFFTQNSDSAVIEGPPFYTIAPLTPSP
jgi:hypothetical protein